MVKAWVHFFMMILKLPSKMNADPIKLNQLKSLCKMKISTIKLMTSYEYVSGTTSYEVPSCNARLAVIYAKKFMPASKSRTSITSIL